MTSFKRYAISVCVLAVLSGCGGFVVNDDSETPLPGVPFYVIVGAVSQSTVYHRSWINLRVDSVEVKADGTPIKGSERKVEIRLAPTYFDYDGLVENLVKIDHKTRQTDFSKTIQRLNASLKVCGKQPTSNCRVSHTAFLAETDISFNGTPSMLRQVVASNAITPTTKVDYSKTYYFNTTIPFLGTNAAELSLNENGTLALAKSTSDTTKLAEVLPIKDFLLDKLSIGGDAETGDAAAGVSSLSSTLSKDKKFRAAARRTKPSPKQRLTFDIGTDGYAYTLSKTFSLDNTPGARLAFSSDGVSISRKRFADTGTAKKRMTAIQSNLVAQLRYPRP